MRNRSKEPLNHSIVSFVFASILTMHNRQFFASIADMTYDGCMIIFVASKLINQRSLYNTFGAQSIIIALVSYVPNGHTVLTRKG